MTLRARRRREEAVRRLVGEIHHEWMVAGVVATALERNMDRELHAELVQETKDNAGRIGQICHDHGNYLVLVHHWCLFHTTSHSSF